MTTETTAQARLPARVLGRRRPRLHPDRRGDRPRAAAPAPRGGDGHRPDHLRGGPPRALERQRRARARDREPRGLPDHGRDPRLPAVHPHRGRRAPLLRAVPAVHVGDARHDDPLHARAPRRARPRRRHVALQRPDHRHRAPARRRPDVPGLRRRRGLLLGRQHLPPERHRRHRPRLVLPERRGRLLGPARRSRRSRSWRTTRSSPTWRRSTAVLAHAGEPAPRPARDDRRQPRRRHADPRARRQVRQGRRQGRHAARARRQPARLRGGARHDPGRHLQRAPDPGGAR